MRKRKLKLLNHIRDTKESQIGIVNNIHMISQFIFDKSMTVGFCR